MVINILVTVIFQGSLPCCCSLVFSYTSWILVTVTVVSGTISKCRSDTNDWSFSVIIHTSLRPTSTMECEVYAHYAKSGLDTCCPVEDKTVWRFFPAFLINGHEATNFINTVQGVPFILGVPSKVKVKMKHILLQVHGFTSSYRTNSSQCSKIADSNGKLKWYLPNPMDTIYTFLLSRIWSQLT